MQKLHIHGWAKVNVSRKKHFICRTNPKCFITREWEHIVYRYATCLDCFEQYIVLPYQISHHELTCHKCTGRTLTAKEMLMLTRLQVEAEKDEFIRTVACIQEKPEDKPRELNPERLTILLPKLIMEEMEKKKKEIPVEIQPDKPIRVEDHDIKLKDYISPEEEKLLRDEIDKQMQKLREIGSL
jgi:hypothetical protein